MLLRARIKTSRLPAASPASSIAVSPFLPRIRLCKNPAKEPQVPYKAAWIEGIGVAFALLNIALFVMNCVLITIRFHLRPGSFIGSFTDQVESLFINAFVSS